jgi:hypothetical protein
LKRRSATSYGSLSFTRIVVMTAEIPKVMRRRIKP